ncbi:MAG: T9SS type A sorting domain-containing protein, partial [Phaeodactylibacter sp.]|nr:T9SS type A sorting domain-containing protein [Phaeodactylibacter sp.]
FRNLEGTENGLVFYINFDLDDEQSDSIFDLSIEGNDCDRVNLDETNLVSSTAILGNTTTQGHEDLHGLWFGNSTNFLDPRLTTSDNGLSLSAYYFGQDSSAYVVWGHNGEAGITQENLPADAPPNTKRSKRVWHATTFGTIKPSFIVDLQATAGGGTALSSEKPINHYTLLERQEGASTFTAVAYAENKNGNELTFNWVPVKSAFYAIAVGDAPFDVTNTPEIGRPDFSFELFPNPNAGTFVLSGPQSAGEAVQLEVFDAAGKRIFHQVEADFSGQVELQLERQSGFYLLQWTTAGRTGTKRFLIQ